MKTEYFFWLLDVVGVDYSITKYQKLYEKLHNTEFHIVHPRDNNRWMDGADLKWKYHSETGNDVLEEEDSCSVLEMLVALARRLDLEWSGTPGDPAPEKLFWNMIQNLGLQKYSDRRWDLEKVDEILWKFMKKNDRNCMIFPVPEDLNLEFWDQAIHFLSRKKKTYL